MEKEENVNARIPSVDAILFAIIIETALLQMHILDSHIKLNIKRFVSPSVHSRKTTSKIDKLFRERKSVKDVLSIILLQLTEQGKYNHLQEIVSLLKFGSASLVNLGQMNEELHRQKTDLKSKIYLQKDDHKTKLNRVDEYSAVLRDEIEDSKLNVRTRLIYAEKWLKAKMDTFEQHVPNIHIPFTQLNNEKRIHKEIVRAYEITIKEKEDAVKYWHERFTKDITCMKENIATKREHLENTITKCGELQQLFSLHAGEMNAWLTFKRERAARRAREERARISATLIQGWWRGVMVRRALGAFRYLRHKKSSTKMKKKN